MEEADSKLLTHNGYGGPEVCVGGTSYDRSSIHMGTAPTFSFWCVNVNSLGISANRAIAWPSSWFAHAPSQSTVNDDSDSDGGSDAGEDGKPSVSAPPSELAVTQAYKEFLGFLELGCNGSPALGYPIVMLVISSLPSEVSSYI